MALTDSLISFWELEEASGTRVDSVVASANDLTDNNTVTQNTGKVGNCAQFTKANSEFLSRASNASLVTGDIDFSFALWVYFDETSAGNIISKDNGATFEYDLYRVAAGHVRWYVEGAASSSDFELLNNPSLSTWYFIVCWHDSVNNIAGGSIDDGTPTTVSYSGGARSTAHPFGIVGAPYLGGRIDQVGFWKKVLTAEDITALYNGGAGLSYAGMASETPRRLILSSPLG